MQTTTERRTVDASMLGSSPLRGYGRRLARLRKDLVDEAQVSLHAARRNVREARRRAEDERDAVAIGIRRHPFRAVGLAFALGGLVAFVAEGIARKRPRR